MALSDEDKAIMAYAKDSGVPHVVTSTTNHSISTVSGNTSYHVMMGTNGQGLAVDFAGPHGGRDTKELEAIWAVFHATGSHLAELIYAGHQCIKNGHPYAYPSDVLRGHHDHVHVAVNKGVFLKWHTAEVVHPMYDPPIHMGPIVADAFVAGTQQHYLLDENGGIYTFGGAPFHGSAYGDPRVPAGTKFARLEADAAGYTAISVSGDRYGFPH
jgi:hypothetical protein